MRKDCPQPQVLIEENPNRYIIFSVSIFFKILFASLLITIRIISKEFFARDMGSHQMPSSVREFIRVMENVEADTKEKKILSC